MYAGDVQDRHIPGSPACAGIGPEMAMLAPAAANWFPRLRGDRPAMELKPSRRIASSRFPRLRGDRPASASDDVGRRRTVPPPARG